MKRVLRLLTSLCIVVMTNPGQAFAQSSGDESAAAVTPPAAPNAETADGVAPISTTTTTTKNETTTTTRTVLSPGESPASDGTASDTPAPDVTASDTTDDDGHTEGIALHSAGLEAELDGRDQEALELFRQAHQTAPTDDMVTFDLARLSYELESPSWKQDAEDFMKLEPATPDANLLLAYLKLEMGQNEQALEPVNRVLAARPGDTEAMALHQMLAPPPQNKQPFFRVAGVVRAGAAVDSNVLIDANAQFSEAGGVRILTNGLVYAAIRPDQWEIDTGAIFDLGMHANNTDVLTAYNTAMVGGFAGATRKFDGFSLGVGGRASGLWLDNFNDPFVRGGQGSVTASMPVGWLKLSLDAAVGYQDFLGSLGSGAAGSGNNRDGLTVASGVRASMKAGRIVAAANAGFALLRSQGAQMANMGPVAGVSGGWHTKSIKVDAGFNYQMRDYYDQPQNRVDHFIAPTVSFAYYFFENLGLRAGYSYNQNISFIEPGASNGADSTTYDYTRHIAQLAMEGRW